MADKQIKELQLQLDFVEDKLRAQKNFIDTHRYNYSTNLEAFKLRFEALSGYLGEFSDYHRQVIILVDDAQMTAVKSRYQAFEEAVFSVQTEYLEFINNSLSQIKLESPTKSQLVISAFEKPRVKLPEFELPKFDGKIESFPAFRDQFEIMINTTKLEKIEKFQYLVACCKGGDAERIINQFKITDDNYDLAFQTLAEKYTDNRILVDRHFAEIMKIVPFSQDSPEELRKLLECYSTRYRQLKREVVDVNELFDSLMIHAAAYRLDERTRRGWELSCEKGKLPSWQSFENYIENRCRVNDQIAQTSAASRKSSENK